MITESEEKIEFIIGERAIIAAIEYEKKCEKDFVDAVKFADEEDLKEWAERWQNARDLIKSIAVFLSNPDIANAPRILGG